MTWALERRATGIGAVCALAVGACVERGDALDDVLSTTPPAATAAR